MPFGPELVPTRTDDGAETTQRAMPTDRCTTQTALYPD